MRKGKIALVVSHFNELITQTLLQGAVETFTSQGLAKDQLEILHVPGAYEIPYAVQHALDAKQCVGAVALGCLIEGQTPHFQLIAQAVFDGLMRVSLDQKAPVTNAVLTCHTIEQALDRCGIKSGHKGKEAAQALLDLLDLFQNEL